MVDFKRFPKEYANASDKSIGRVGLATAIGGIVIMQIASMFAVWSFGFGLGLLGVKIIGTYERRIYSKIVISDLREYQKLYSRRKEGE